MKNKINDYLGYLNLFYLKDNWENEVKKSSDKNYTIRKFFGEIIRKEYEEKKERSRNSRVKQAQLPVEYTIEGYPFERQPHINKKRLLNNYESLDYMEKKRNMIMIGATGVGKTGLATAFLLNAINNGYKGRFILFAELIKDLWSSRADGTEMKVMKKYASYDCLVIDELGYTHVEPSQSELLFLLINKRYKKTCTIITTNLSIGDWQQYLGKGEMVTALIARLKDNGHIVNFKGGKSIRAEADED